jgi:hypothetical protein
VYNVGLSTNLGGIQQLSITCFTNRIGYFNVELDVGKQGKSPSRCTLPRKALDGWN